MAGEKTEKATPKRKQDERKKGNIFQSKEVVTVFSMVATFYAFKFLTVLIFPAIEGCIATFIELCVSIELLEADMISEIFLKAVFYFVIAAGPLLLVSGVLGIILTGAQTKFLTSFKLLNFKGNRINPISGFKKMFSMRGIVEIVKSLLKIAVLAYICYDTVQENLYVFPKLMDMEITQMVTNVGEIIMSIVNGIIPIFIILALADYAYQWWEYEKNLKMSKQEIKEEYKQTEGDPQIKGKIRERQQQQARNRMMQAVPSADVVIRNPTHYAVAIRYDPEKDNAPIVVAKGADLTALRIIEIAKENDVVLIENRPLARGLYEAVDLEREVPEQFYQSVAEAIAFVYSLREKKLGNYTN